MDNAVEFSWEHLLEWLNAGLFTVGTTPVSTLGILRVLLFVLLFVFISRLVRHALERIATRLPGINQSAFYTLGRVLHYVLLVIGVMVGFSTIGVNFTNLAVVVGALGVGIGFGLQSIVANFVAGLIILFERPLKVGDFVELESGVHGEVREIRMRATRITTNDNLDILVPNSEFTTGRVINWTLDEANRRIRVPFGVAYGSDKVKVRDAVLDAAERVPHTLKGVPKRAPQVWFVNFGDSSLDFQLVVWLNADAVKRPAAVQAAYLWEIHTALEQNGIEVPFPQRDLHVRSVFGLAAGDAKTWIDERSKPAAAGSAGAA